MKKRILISSILGGVSPTQYIGAGGSYDSAIGIDPDFPLLDTGTETGLRTSGVIRPVAYESFDGAEINDNPYWLITNPKNTLLYAYLKNGKIVSYSSSLGSETSVGTPTSGAGNGARYYNNYIYFSTPTDVSRYGPLSGASLTNTFWTSTLGKTALGNKTYPSIRGSGTLPNHVLHSHPADDKLYILDFDPTTSTAATRGRGLVHYIKTTYGSAEGDTNNGSSYNALDLPLGFMPTCAESYGTSMVIGAIQTTDATVNQGRSCLFFWDTTSTISYYRMVFIPEPFVTAIKNVNGYLYVWAGKLSATGGYSVFQYVGGETFREVAQFDEGHPPLQGAVDAMGDKVVWGSWITYPANAAVAWSYGSKDSRVPAAVHCIARATASASASDGVVTALQFALQQSNALPGMVMGWRDASNYGLDKLSTTYQTHIFRSQRFNINEDFEIERVSIPLGAAVTANMTITPSIYADDATSITALDTINNTNYTLSERRVVLTSKRPAGRNNFFLHLAHTGTALLPVLLPIEIIIETKEG